MPITLKRRSYHIQMCVEIYEESESHQNIRSKATENIVSGEFQVTLWSRSCITPVIASRRGDIASIASSRGAAVQTLALPALVAAAVQQHFLTSPGGMCLVQL